MVSTGDQHGGNVYAAGRERRLPLRRIVDFSASINPLGPSARSLNALSNARGAVSHYPDPTCLDLRRALGRRYRIAPDQLLIGNGSSELIYLLPGALAIHHALIVGPTFSEYERAVLTCRGKVTKICARRAEQFRPPLGRVLAAMREKGGRRKLDAVFLCNPNSPTGRAISREETCMLIEAAARYRMRIIVDEAFIDYCEERSVLSRVRRYGHLVVLRSFTKFYGLPGLRVGYVAASKEDIARIRRRQPPWSVNALGQAAGCAALEDRRYAEASRQFMRTERAYLLRRLGELPGITVYPSDANFLLIELPPRMPSSSLASALRGQSILIRDLSSFAGMNARMVRVAVRTRRENKRLLSAFSRAFKAFTI